MSLRDPTGTDAAFGTDPVSSPTDDSSCYLPTICRHFPSFECFTRVIGTG
jgi:hypothetical protein